jgi:hypothetical protein
MKSTARLFGDFLALALDHPDGPAAVRAYDRTLQFSLTDDAPFFLTARDGTLTVQEGDCGLDWQYGDWRRVTCVRTSARTLRQIVAGERLASEAFFDRELGFAPRRMADPETGAAAVVAWFYTLIRLAHEQLDRLAEERFRAEIGVD